MAKMIWWCNAKKDLKVAKEWRVIQKLVFDAWEQITVHTIALTWVPMLPRQNVTTIIKSRGKETKMF